MCSKHQDDGEMESVFATLLILPWVEAPSEWLYLPIATLMHHTCKCVQTCGTGTSYGCSVAFAICASQSPA
jgi:hypothetical protein